jgi:hypothetical protein
MKIRRFVRGSDDISWSSFVEVDVDEFRKGMGDPEFSDEGMFLAEEQGQVVGVINAHISPSYNRFCMIRNFTVNDKYWDSVAPSLLGAALQSFRERGAPAVETCFPEQS